jgi:hypothetical protein
MYAFIQNNQVTQVGELAVLSNGVFIRAQGTAFTEWAQQNNAVEVVEGEQKDQRFYWVTFSHYDVNAGSVTRVYTNTPKALDDDGETKGLKSQWIAQGKVSANSQLAATDWMVIRKAERDVAIPADVVAERAKIIADCTAKEAAILAATTIDALIAVVAPVNTEMP